MERLTSRVLNDLGGVAFIHCHQEDCDGDCLSCSVQVEAEHKLKKYEDLEEQGLLLRLPCKMGDKVYWICGKNIYDVIVRGFGLEASKILLMDYSGYRFGIMGVDSFLTKEEAEQKLAEMRGE